MGGNTTIKNKQNKTFKAESIPLELIGRQNFIKTTNEMLLKLNRLFDRYHKNRLWLDTELITQGTVFNGSTSYVMDPVYLDEDILPYKKDVGDVDIMIDRNNGENLYTLLDVLEGKQITSSVKYLGNNSNSIDKLGNTIICIFEMQFQKKTINVQIDFELSEFQDGKPTEWSAFSHSSSISDAKEGFKGVMQKHLLRAMVGAKSSRKDIILLTPTSTFMNFKLKKMNEDVVRLMQFGVDSGIGSNFDQVLYEGEPFKINGKFAWKEKAKKDKTYIKCLDLLKETIFNKKTDNKSIESFIGILEAGKCLKLTEKIDASDRFFDILFGINTQVQPIEPNDWKKDTEIKLNAYYKIIKEWDLPQRENLSGIISEYVKKAFYKDVLKAIEAARIRICDKVMTKGVELQVLNSAESALTETELLNAFNEAWNVKGILQKDKDAIFNEIKTLGTSVEDKLQFLKMVKRYKTTTLMVVHANRKNALDDDNKVFNLKDVIHTSIKNTETFHELYEFLKNYKLNGQLGKGATGVGRAEAFLMFFGKDAGFAEIGDVQIEDKLFEVKFGHANLGYSGKIVTKPNDVFHGIFHDYGFASELDLDILKTDKNAFNFKKGNQFEKVFNHPDMTFYTAFRILCDCFSLVFGDIEDMKPYIHNMLCTDGQLAPRDIIYLNLAEYIFKKYQENEAFDYMMCFSSDGERVVNIRNYNDFSKHDFKFDNFSWGGKMQQTVACTLK